MIGQQVDTPTTQIVAQERGVYGTGHNRDLREFAPKATFCSSVWVWDRYLVPELKKIAAGNWKPVRMAHSLGIKDGGTDIACCNSIVPKDVVDKVMAERADDHQAASKSSPVRSPIATARSASPPEKCWRTATCGRWTGTLTGSLLRRSDRAWATRPR